MNRLVIDCSVTMAWCFEDECDGYADAALAALAARLGVDHRHLAEVAPGVELREASSSSRCADRAGDRDQDTLDHLSLFEDVLTAHPFAPRAQLRQSQKLSRLQ